MTNALLIVLRFALAAGAVFGLGMCGYASFHGDWQIAGISFLLYAFSTVMLS
jgi:hypothetical protein